jgi:pilus assembly protein CpaF
MTGPALVREVRHRLAGRPEQSTGEGTAGGEEPAEREELARIVRRDRGVLADDVVAARWRVQLAAELDGAGPLEPLLADPTVTDVLVNGPDDVWVDRGEGLCRAAVRFGDESAVRQLAVRMAMRLGRRLDSAAPWVDAALPDGTRLHAIVPPLTRATTISLRVLARRRLDLAALVACGTVPAAAEAILRCAIAGRRTCLISGGTGTGKTTLLGAMLDLVPPNQRILVIEDAAEIVTTHPHAVRLLARAPNIEGVGGVGLPELVRQSLRMRPDRIVVGEFRGAEVAELLAALNTGHNGGAVSVHANSIRDVPARLLALGAMAGLDAPALVTQAESGIDLVVHLRRGSDGRRLAAIGELAVVGGALRIVPLWQDERS